MEALLSDLVTYPSFGLKPNTNRCRIILDAGLTNFCWIWLAQQQDGMGTIPMSTVREHSTDNPARVEFWKSLLRVEAELAVTLARQELPVERILQFVPGVMIQFEKPCDTPLTVEIDGHTIAEGEVVKIGDKFGLRITEICNREERWVPLISEEKPSN